MSIEHRFSDLQVEVNSLICAGKKIHDILIDAARLILGWKMLLASMYRNASCMMSDLHHSNITLFLGVCFLPDCQLPAVCC